MHELILRSQTACLPAQRRLALRRIGNRYHCDVHPEVMSALLCGLHDCDARVRRVAADEIGDQLRMHPCCCTPAVVHALAAALSDCDWWVRSEAQQALRVCGYTIVSGPIHQPICCDGCCDLFCDSGCDWLHSRFSSPDEDWEETADDDAPRVEERPYIPPKPQSPMSPGTAPPFAPPVQPGEEDRQRAAYFPVSGVSARPLPPR